MKKFFLSNLIIVAIFIGAVFVSCEKENDEKVKLLDTVVENNENNRYSKFEYDNQNRISKIISHYDGKVTRTETFTYSGNELKVAISYVDYPEDNRERVYVQNGNTITVKGYDDEKITVNNDGYMTKMESSGDDWSSEEIFQYQGGNLTKYTYVEIYEGKRAVGVVSHTPTQ